MVSRQVRSIQNIVLLLLAVVFIPVGLKLGAPYLGPIFLSIFLAIILTPILKWFTNRGLSYRSALALTVGVSIAIGLILLAFIVLTLAGLKDQILSYQSSFSQTSEPLRSLFQLLSSNVQITQVASIFFDGVFILFGTLFLLIEIPRLHESMVTRLGADHAIVRGTEELYHDILDYFVVRIKVNFYTSIGVTVALLVLGINYALLWGFLAFALSFVPYVGYAIAALPPILIAWTQYGLPGVVAVIVIYGAVNIIAEYLIFPQLASRAFAIPIYIVFVSVFFWGWILGLAGVLLAVPLTMAVIIFFAQFEETAWLVPIFRGGRSKHKAKGPFKKRVYKRSGSEEMKTDTSQMSGYARRWWGKVLFGIIAIIFGIVAFVYPRATVIIFLYLFGIFLLISGIVLISYAFRGAGTHRWLNFVEGIFSIIIAIILFISPRFSALTIAYIFAFFAIVYGVLQIVESLFLPRGDSSHGYTNRWFLFLAGIWSLLIGILIALFPAGGILAVIWLVAAFAIVVGILNILNGFQMRRQMVRGAGVA